MKSALFRRAPAIDLKTAIPDAETEYVLLDRIPSVSGWKRLAELPALRKISAVKCGGQEAGPGGNRAKLDELYIHTLSPACLGALCGLSDARSVTIWHDETPVLDLALLRGHARLRELFLHCGIAVGFAHVAKAPLERLHVSNLSWDGDFPGALKGWRDSLAELWLENNEPFGPERLPALPKLKELRVPSHPETVEAWKGWRDAHPGIALKFTRPVPPSAKSPAASILEIHRDAAIVKLLAGKKLSYESWGDFTADTRVEGDNHDLRAWLEKTAAKAKRKLACFSDADQMGIRAAKVEDVRWAIDALRDGKAA